MSQAPDAALSAFFVLSHGALSWMLECWWANMIEYMLAHVLACTCFLHCIALRCVALNCAALRCAALHQYVTCMRGRLLALRAWVAIARADLRVAQLQQLAAGLRADARDSVAAVERLRKRTKTRSGRQASV